MTVSSSDLAILSRLLDEALDLDADARAAWLDALPESERHLAPLLREMLAENDRVRTSGFLSSIPVLDDASDVSGTTATAGEVVGAYRLLREIGRGGMGEVWLAERADGAFRRQVALKLPRLAWGAGLGQRMAREREIGALLEHPGIARLYDAGVDALGRPYLALEYVDGQTLDAYCRARSLSVRDRLRLFLQVAHAVAYAHGRLIVHRDLKPSNVMVTPDDQVHLLDFGIAKLLHEDGVIVTQLTEGNGRVLTPHYAAPEQLRGEVVTVASDVYSLGVLLYEMLAGKRPHDPKRTSLASLEEEILEHEPQKASQRADDRVVARELRGDIDAILAKALKRVPGDRYATVDAMAQDIERFLAGERVLAQPDRLGYRIGKAVGRHRVGFAALGAATLSLVVGSGVAIDQARRAQAAARQATAQATRANVEAQRARAVKDFVVDVFRVNSHEDPNNNAARQLPVELLIERGAMLIGKKFERQPELQAELYGVVSELFENFPDSDLAATYSQKEIDALTRFQAPDEQRVTALLRQTRALINAHRLAEANSAMQVALAAASGRPALLLQVHIQRIRMLEDMASFDEAHAELGTAEALAANSREVSAADQAYLLYLRAICVQLCRKNDVERYLENTLSRSGSIESSRFADSLPLFARALQMSVLAVGDQSPQTQEIRTTYMRELTSAGKAMEAKKQLEIQLRAMRAAGGPDDVRAASIEIRQTINLYEQDVVSFSELVDTIHRDQETVAAYGSRLPPAFRARMDFRLGDAYSDGGDIADAEALTLPAARLLLKLELNAEDREYYLFALGWTAKFAGRHAEADATLRQVMDLRKKTMPDFWKQCLGILARNLSMQGRFSEAEALIAGAEQPVANGMHDPSLVEDIARVRLDKGDPKGAIDVLKGDLADYEPIEFEDASTMRAEAFCETGHERDGMSLLDAFIKQHSARTYAYHPGLARMRSIEGLCAAKIGLMKKAAELAALSRVAFERQPGVSPYFKAPLQKLERVLDKAGQGRGAGE